MKLYAQQKETVRKYYKYTIHNYRFLKLEIDSVHSGSVMQSSRFEFIDANNNYVTAPSMVNYQVTNCTIPSGEDPSKLFDHNVNTKMCPNATAFPMTIIMDFGKIWLDTSIYSRWQWYTANDATPERNMKTYRLYGSVDGSNWYLLDSVINGYYTSSTKTLAYTGNIKKYVEPATEDDYDFYEDVEVYQVPVINNKYYASKQGVNNGN